MPKKEHPEEEPQKMKVRLQVEHHLEVLALVVRSKRVSKKMTKRRSKEFWPKGLKAQNRSEKRARKEAEIRRPQA